MELKEIVYKLVGRIDPVGEHHTDKVRYENLETMIGLVDSLLADIDRVAYENKDRVEDSMKSAGKRASKFFDDLGIQD